MFQNFKKLLIVLAVILACIAVGILGWELYDRNTDRSGWKTSGDNLYYTDFYGDPVSGWQEIDGKTYYFGLNKYLHTGWLHAEDGSYFFRDDGSMHTGWLEAEDGRYFFRDDGRMYTGWMEDEDGRYFFSDDGRMYTGWLDAEEGSFFFLDDGRMQTGWVERNGQRRYITEDGTPHTGWLELEEGTYYLDSDGTLHTGWLELEEGTYYLSSDGTPYAGWLEDGDNRYYLNEDGTIYTGWLEQGEYRYYFLENGVMATGPNQIDGTTYYFTPHGIHLILVNRDHPVPEDYKPELMTVSPYGFQVDVSCLDALNQMLADCRAAGCSFTFNSAYRSVEEQWWILNTRTKEYMATGLSYGAAYSKTLLSVAYPGTSEHHLGLAVDILGNAALKWLQEHCWEYGFILRYLEGKTDITGIMHEPWHFRYVGKEVSMDMKDTGLCLEEYLGAYIPEDTAE